MAQDIKVKLPTSVPAEATLTQEKFDLGVITLINESALPPRALKEATNCLLYEDGRPGPRWGTDWYGTALPNGAAIDGASVYQTSLGANHIVAVGGGVVYRSLDNAATWTACTAVSLTSGVKCYFEQANNFLYIVNGTDNITRYDGSTILQQYTALATPSGVSATATGVSGSAFTYYYKITAVNAIGLTAGSPTATVGVTSQRENWDPTNAGGKFVTVNWTAVPNATRYDIYVTDNAVDNTLNNHLYLDSVGTNTYIDNGQQVANPNSTVPIADTTVGPKIAFLGYVGSRLWGTRDTNNPQRVWWTGSGPFIGYFSDAYDGGYIDLQKGSQFRPMTVVDYRDGRGNPLATVFCDSADGRGCVWQISLATSTAFGASFTQPSAYKLPGSRGTNAPNSVVNVLNDYMFFNYQALYNLGSRINYQQLLSTDESTANIRPTLINNITPSATSGIAAYYFQAKVFISAPFGNSSNNTTIVYDTERKAYLPQAYTIGAERYFQYTDNTAGVKNQHLLFWKTGDNRLSETNSNIQGDYGQSFATSIITGLIPINPKNRFTYLWCEQGQLEFAIPTGNINIELLGIERNRGLSSQKTTSIARRTTNVGWSTFSWSSNSWTDTSLVPQLYSESTVQRYFNVQREIKSYQWHISTNDVTAGFVLRTLQIQGTPTLSDQPRQERLT